MLVEKPCSVECEMSFFLRDVFFFETWVRLVIGWDRSFSFSVSCVRFLKLLWKFVPSTYFWRSETLHFSVVKFVEIIAVGVGILWFYGPFHIFKISFAYSILLRELRSTGGISIVMDSIYIDFVLIKNWSFRWDLLHLNSRLCEFFTGIWVIWLFRPRIRRQIVILVRLHFKICNQ